MTTSPPRGWARVAVPAVLGCLLASCTSSNDGTANGSPVFVAGSLPAAERAAG